MIKIAVTGSMGSGKTTVCHELSRKYKIPLFNSDKFVKELYRDNLELKSLLIERYGEKVYNGQEINSKFLSSIIFSKSEELDWVNNLVAPYVRSGFEEFCKSKEGESDFCIMEAALVYEHGIQSLFDFVIYVTAPEKVRIERIKRRDHHSEAHIKERTKHFMDEDTKIIQADFVIDTFRPQLNIQEQCGLMVQRFPLTEGIRSKIMESLNKEKETSFQDLRLSGVNIYHLRKMKIELVNNQKYEEATFIRDLEKMME